MKVQIGSWAWVEKNAITSEQERRIKNALTVRPLKTGPPNSEDPKPVPLYVETEGLLGMAREWYLGLPPNPAHQVEWKLHDGDRTGWKDLQTMEGFTLRPQQEEAVQAFARAWNEGLTAGRLEAAPGWGKTVFACALLARLQVPALVVVHKKFLMDQWAERINQFLPGAEIGYVQGSVCAYEGKQIVLAMAQSLAQREYPLGLYRHPGMIIFDEAHHVPAATFGTIPGKFPARFRLGVSATWRRKDGTGHVFDYLLGPIRYRATEQRLKVRVRKVPTQFRLIAAPNLNPALIQKNLLLRFLCNSTRRNKVIVDQIHQAVMAGRKCIVLSERVEHLKVLEDLTKSSWKNPGPAPTTGLYIGGMKDLEYEASKECQVIFATAQLVSEGFDLPQLDTIFLTTPMFDVEQSVGRIQRPFEGKKDPVVVDFRDDDIPLCAKAAEARERFYSKVSA